ncbi:3-(3-hydroxyphenyl)propionate hydroxylase [Actinoplanes italicus]|uniref:3-(3-hydroxy-phenyl)propionate hydroxylase n=1 Tax=Actinoplanes italicus TaxID=113567 RepID=A0A2T0JR79_9ACTN|nr:FAD-dependent monooxygenase [Actinoplanes italicus]PRX10136.1 3-(3-hydroxy-phenyl)propionate hydroxylase [Actinoplanes italicus]GIE34943.1 3-(3-hydroxyphenyl)propionate hydroxylase [Actinoplanes italicus]
MNDERATVIVAGMGPVGALLAALLGGRGVATVVVEPQHRPYPKPRAAVLDAEAIRALSLVPGLPPAEAWATPVDRNGVMDARHRPLFMTEQTARVFGHPQIARLDQPALEAGLRAAATGTGNVRILAGRSVTAVEQDDDGITAVLDDGGRVTGRWLVGCDGLGSTVRTAAGIGFPGDTYPQPWLVVDASNREPADIASSVAFVLDPARPCVAMSQRDRRRWEWMLLPGEDPDRMAADETVRSLVGAWVDPGGLDIDRAAVFTFHARTAERWRAGRVLLAGDAAHVMPPFAGAGLGMGIRDAAALAWRLADVAGGADPVLLDGYERERRPDVEAMTTLASRMGRIVQSRSRTTVRLTRLVLRMLAPLAGLGARPLPARRLPRSVAGRLPGAGRPLPNPRVSVGGGPPQRLDDVVGYRWAYIGHGVDPRTVTAGIPAGAVLLALDRPDPAPGCLPIADLDGLLTARPGSVTVARPDRFLQGRLTGHS